MSSIREQIDSRNKNLDSRPLTLDFRSDQSGIDSRNKTLESRDNQS